MRHVPHRSTKQLNRSVSNSSNNPQALSRRAWPRHWRRHGMICPSAAGIAAFVFDAGFWFMGLLLDDRALMAAALAVTLIIGMSLLLAIAQWMLVARVDSSFINEHRGTLDIPSTMMPLPRLLLPHTMRMRSQYERLNQDGQVISRHVGSRPSDRGLYRRTGLFVRWYDPFSLWSASRILLRHDDEIVLPPVAEQPANGQRIADQRMQGMTQSENTGGVRAYAAGDPPKLISWKATAHRGELMTRETGRDMRMSTIVLLDVRSQDVTNAQVDAQVERVLPMLHSSSSDSQLIITDGVQFADVDSARLLAAMSPIPPAGAPVSADASAAGVTGGASAGATVSADNHHRDDTQLSPAIIANRVADIMAHHHGVIGVRLITANPQGALATALRQSIGDDRLRVIDVPANSTDYRRETSSQRVRNRKVTETTITSTLQTQPRALSRILTAAALLVFFTLSITALTGLVAATGYWPWFAAVALAIVAIESVLPTRSTVRYVIRTVSVIVAIFVAAAALIVIRVHDIANIWLFDHAAFQRINDTTVTSASDGTQAAQHITQVTPFTLIGNIFSRGFDLLDAQLPPLTVNQSSDVVLIAIASLVVVIIRLILIARRVAPALAVLPVALLAADYALIGRNTDWWQIALLAVAFLVALWQSRASRITPPTPAICVALVTAVTLALTTPAVSFAQAVPLSFGDSAGLLSANTINPMVDLKRSLTTGSDSTVLTYRANNRTYLRMTTLDDFNGDMWSFDEALSKDANLYGSGIQLGLDSSNIMSEEERMRNIDDPLSLYAMIGYMYGGNGAYYSDNFSGNGNSGSGSSSGEGPSDDYEYGDGGTSRDPRNYGRYGSRNTRFMSLASAEYQRSADVTIETLSSRFLPLPGVTTVMASGIDSTWLSAGSTIYNRTTTTGQGMQYRTSGVGLDPVTATAGFTRISDVHDVYQKLVDEAQGSDDMPWNERIAAREQLVSEGIAEQHDDWWVMPITVSSGDGSGAAEAGDLVTDSQGNEVGTVSGISGHVGFGNSGIIPTYSITLASVFRSRVGIGSDEAVGFMYAEDGRIALVLAMRQMSVDDGLTGNSTDGSAGDTARNGNDFFDNANSSNYGESWFARGFGDLQSDLGYRSMTVDSAGSVQSALARYATGRVTLMDVQARTRYRSLPADLPANVTALVAQAKAAGVATDGDGYDHQVAAMRWLVDYFTNPANNFVYSLNAPDGNGRSNLDVINNFLDLRSGYCTHYASALAVLGRAMGVPTRMVLGYNAGVERANADGEFEVAAKQLHAWIDAYIDGVGWVPFDVTPATSENGSASADAASGVGAGTDGADAGDGADATTTTPNSGTNGANGDGTGTTNGDVNDMQGAESDAAKRQNGDNGADAADGTDVTSSADGQSVSWWDRLKLPRWAAITLVVVASVACVMGLALIPAGVRALRRRRRLRVVDSAGGAGAGDGRGAGITDRGTAAWLAAWSEICDCAWDIGVRWTASDTERTIARLIADVISDNASSDGDSHSQHDNTRDQNCDISASLAQISDRVTAIAFGVSQDTGIRADDLREQTDTVLAKLGDVDRRHPVWIRLRNFLMPASLLHRVKR